MIFKYASLTFSEVHFFLSLVLVVDLNQLGLPSKDMYVCIRDVAIAQVQYFLHSGGS